MRILIVQKEENNFIDAKSWAFHSQIGWYKAAEHLGFEVDIYFTTFPFPLEDFLCDKKKYDLTICNCILHLFKESDPSINSADLIELRNKSKKLIGLTIEQTIYYDINGEVFDFSQDRINGVNKVVKYFDAIGVFFSPDVSFFQNKVSQIFTIGPTLPVFYLNTPPLNFLEKFLRRFRKSTLLIASLYGERKQIYLNNKKHIRLGRIYDKDLSNQFLLISDKLKNLTSQNKNDLDKIIREIINLKEEYFLRYIALVRKHHFLLHPPAFYSGLHCRFIESLAAKTVCIHPKISNEIRTFPLKENILFYENTNMLKNQITSKIKQNDSNFLISEVYTTEYDLLRIINLVK